MNLRTLVYSLYERRLAGKLAGKPVPRHVGVMCDGNRRWAREMGYVDPNDGHRVGAAKIKHLLAWCDQAGVGHVTLYLLATDNLQRPAAELDPLLQIIEDLVVELAEDGNPWRLRMVGALDLLPAPTSAALKAAQERTRDRSGGAEVNIAVGYGGRREIADAVRSLLHEHAAAGGTIEELAEILDVEHIAEHLYTRGPARSGPGHPDQRRAAAVRFPAVAVGALGVLLPRRELAGLPAHRLPARPALVRRPPASLRCLSSG